MSGIAGIFYRNDKSVQVEQLHAMGAALAHRGPDGIHYYHKGSIGFVQCMLHDTPESILESLPNTTEDGNFVITFHGRIDNRQELYDKIGWIKPLSVVTDSDLVLSAYRKWRRECANHLLGDFAFAVWDQTERKLFCARDPVGIKPFYYYVDDERFVFASEIKGIFAIPEIQRTINDERVADYLTRVVIDNATTFFRKISRLPQGNVLAITKKRFWQTVYHRLQPAQIEGKTDADYAENFREIFIDAVRVRLRSAYPVGAYLSGGLDSSSIVCTAAGLLAKEYKGKLHTFSGVFDALTKCDERKYFSSIISRYDLLSNTLVSDMLNPGPAYEKLIEDEDEPFLMPHIFFIMGLLPLVQQSGVRVLLDGHDGDAAVSYGYNLLVESALTGNLLRFASHFRESSLYSWKNIARRIMSLYWNVLCSKIPVAVPCSAKKRDILRDLKILNPEYAEKCAIKKRLTDALQRLPQLGQREGEYHLKNISQPIHPFSLELFDRMTTRFGVVARYPYFDRRVIEFCLGLPVSQKLNNGLNRSVVRRALADVLPEEISKRRGKTDFNPSLYNAFQKNDQGWLLENIDNMDASNYGIVNKENFLISVARFKEGKSASMHRALKTLLLLVLFSRWKRKMFPQ